MKNQQQDYTNSNYIRASRFRLPFRQKLNTSPEHGQSKANQNVVSFFNLKRFGSSKPGSPTSNLRKSVSFSAATRNSPDGMDWKKKITADHTDVAYREAVSRLRSICNPRPQSQSSPERKSGSSFSRNLLKPLDSPPTKKDRLTTGLLSIFSKDSNSPQQHPISSALQRSYTLNSKNCLPSYLQNQPQGQLASQFQPLPGGGQLIDEDNLVGFIEKQGEYITQLEKETKYCRDELGTMLEKVKDVISENEALHEKQKRDLLSSMIQQLDEKTDTYGHGHGIIPEKSGIHGHGQSTVIRDSRIAELEAQLSQAKRSLRLAQEEVLDYRRGKGNPSNTIDGITSGAAVQNNPGNCELHQTQIENLTREKEDLVETLAKFKQMVSELKDRESDAAKRVKSSLEIVEQMQMEKTQSDMETRRLKEELERHQQRVREMIQDNSRKLQEEKLQVEKKYKQEIDHLNNEMTQEMDSSTKSRLDLERQKRIEADLRREIQQKMGTIDDLRQEMQIKINHLQSELSHCLMLKSTAEQELISARLTAEKVERDGKQDCARLQAEINGLRKRLEQSDADLAKSQEVIVKLNGNVSQLQRESSLAKMRMEGRGAPGDSLDGAEVPSVIRTMEEKHSRDMADLEQLIQVQNNLLDKLRNECKLVTDKLEETSKQNKKERALFESEKDRLIKLNAATHEKSLDLEQKVQYYSSSHDQLVTRLHRLEEDDKTRSDRSCIDTIQNYPESYSEIQKVLLDDLSLILTEMNQWIQTLDTNIEDKVDSDGKKSVNDEKEKLDEEKEKSDDNEKADNPETEKEEKISIFNDDNPEEPKISIFSDEQPRISIFSDDNPVEEPRISIFSDDNDENPNEEETQAEIKPEESESAEEKQKEYNEVVEKANKKLAEMNSQLLDWSKRLQDIITRFSNCSPSKVVS